MQKINLVHEYQLEPGLKTTIDFQLAINEFTDNANSFGFLTGEVEPLQFMSVDSVTERTRSSELPRL